MANNTATLRQSARELVSASVTEAATKGHEQNYEKLHVYRNGTVQWFESINKTDDVIDRHADHFTAVKSVVTVGTGGYACNCDHCNDTGYESKADAVADAVSCDLSDLEQSMLDTFDEIPNGYFDDEDGIR